ncbi:hypothetical protein BC826DRAFT_998783, partial [Russula brevipes]
RLPFDWRCHPKSIVHFLSFFSALAVTQTAEQLMRGMNSQKWRTLRVVCPGLDSFEGSLQENSVPVFLSIVVQLPTNVTIPH